jgi:hypothetical protein
MVWITSQRKRVREHPEVADTTGLHKKSERCHELAPWSFMIVAKQNQN